MVCLHSQMWFYIVQTILSTVLYPVTKLWASFPITEISLQVIFSAEDCESTLNYFNISPALEVCSRFAIAKSMANLYNSFLISIFCLL